VAYHVNYLVPLAVFRILLLCIPLLFHSYTGTALQCAAFYQWLYGGTLVVLLIHMLSLCLINPSSLEAILPWREAATQLATAAAATATATSTSSSSLWQPPGTRTLRSSRFLLEHLHELRRIWWILLLSLLSDVCHWIMLGHVRSSAPSTYSRYYLWPSPNPLHMRQPSLYYAIRSGNMGGDYNTNGIESPPAPPMTYSPQFTTLQECEHELNAYDDYHSEPALVHAMNEFMVDVQQRLHRAKSDWTTRLEDFTARIASLHPDSATMGSSSLRASLPASSAPNTPSTHHHHNRSSSGSSGVATGPHPLFFQLSAFRVM